MVRAACPAERGSYLEWRGYMASDRCMASDGVRMPGAGV